MDKIEFLVKNQWENQTILAFLRHLGLSAGMIRRLKQANGILVNKTPQTVVHRLAAGDTLTLLLPREECHIQPVELPLSVVYEDDWLMVVNKPAGMPVHPSQGHHNDTLANAFAHYMRERPLAFRPITRLDRYTSGLVLIAKNPIAAAHLCRQIAEGKIQKTYYALTQGVPVPSKGSITLPIGRVEGSVIQRQITPLGKPALTHYEVIKAMETTALVKAVPITGRTHQIRVHLAAIGCPLQYDFLYGQEVPGRFFYLQCCGLRFMHPFTQKEVVFQLPQEAVC